MEVTLPISAPVKSVLLAVPAKVNGLTRAATTTVTLPLSFMVAGLMALFFGAGWIVAQPAILTAYHFNPATVALTHLFVLGWICSIVMGALYQLVPVALETKLYSERLVRWHLMCHVTGFTGMVWTFHVWNMKQVGHFGSLFALGVGLFVYNIARTLLRVPKWNVIASAAATALAWLTLTMLAGLLLAATMCSYGTSRTGLFGSMIAGLHVVADWAARFNPLNAMHAHAHLGVIGFFITLIVGVSYTLIPMFTLSELQNRRRAVWSVLLLNLGLAGSFLTILSGSPLRLMFALIIVFGLVLYGLELGAILRARKRRALDWGVKYFLTAVAWLAPLSALAVVLSWPGLPFNGFTAQLENVYGFLGLFSVVSFAIIGMLYKIIPFLVWFGAYSPHIGRAKVPALAEMYSARWQAAGYWTFQVGLVATAIAILTANANGARVGSALLALSLATLALNVGKILLHGLRPRLIPLVKTPLSPIAP